jgi:beta-glucosidase
VVVQYSAGQPTGPGTGRTELRRHDRRKGRSVALFNIATAKETNAYQRIAVEKSQLKIPIVFGLDVIHGFRTVFPVPLALASTLGSARWWSRRLRVAAREASATDGFAGRFSPMVDIAPAMLAGGRMTEGAGEDRFSVQKCSCLRSRIPGNAAGCAGQHRRLRQAITSGTGRCEAGRDYIQQKSPSTPCVKSICLISRSP